MVRYFSGMAVLVAGLTASVGVADVTDRHPIPECVVLAGDVGTAERLCDALRAAVASDPEAVQRFGVARLGLEVVDAAPNRIVARLVTVVADARREGPTLTLDIIDRAELPEKSIVDFARLLIAQTGLSLP